MVIVMVYVIECEHVDFEHEKRFRQYTDGKAIKVGVKRWVCRTHAYCT
jgi:hypothetical protein